MRRIASASAGATDSTRSLSLPSIGTGTELVQTISVTSGSAASLSSAPSAKMPCVQATATDLAPSARSARSNSKIVVPREISSSRMITSRPVTSPISEVILTSVSL
jgi:hypothetical protein